MTGCAQSSVARISQPIGSEENQLPLLAAEAHTETSRVALVTALSGLEPAGRNFAYAPDVDISLPVARPDASLSSAEQLSAILASAGLAARDVGKVVFIEHASAQAAATTPAHTPAVDAKNTATPAAERIVTAMENKAAGRPQLSGGTMMNAPIQRPEDRHEVAKPAARESQQKVAAELAFQSDKTTPSVTSTVTDLASAQPLAVPEVQTPAPIAVPVTEAAAKVEVHAVAPSTAQSAPRRNWARRAELPAASAPAAIDTATKSGSSPVEATAKFEPPVAPPAPVDVAVKEQVTPAPAVAAPPVMAEAEQPVVTASDKAPDTAVSARRNWARRGASMPAVAPDAVAKTETAPVEVAAKTESAPVAAASAPVALPMPEASPAVAAPAAPPAAAPVVAAAMIPQAAAKIETPASAASKPVEKPLAAPVTLTAAQPEKVLATTAPLTAPAKAEMVVAEAAPAVAAPAPAAAAEPAVSIPPATVSVAPPLAQIAPSAQAASMPQVSEAVAAAVSNQNAQTVLNETTGTITPLATASYAHAGQWVAARGQTLHTALKSWCDTAGVQLVWRSEYDYPLSASVSINGDFESAVRTLLLGFSAASPQPVGQLHRQADASAPVLVVSARGNEYGEAK